MSANITAASTSWRRTGCSVTSAVSSADRLTSKNACRSRIARYSGSERPACRMNHTGVRSTASRRAARTSNGSTRPRLPPWRKGRLPSAGANGRSTTRTRARSAARASSSRTPAPSPGATGSGSPTTGSTTAAIRSCGTASARRSPRSRRASGRRGRARARPDPARPLPLRARRRGRAPRLVLGARQRDCERGGRRAAARPARRMPSCPAGSSPAPDAAERIAAAHAEGYARRRRRDRVGRRLRPAAPAGARAVRARAPAGSRTSRTRCSARRCWTGVALERLADVGRPAGVRRAPARSRGSTTAGSSCARTRNAGAGRTDRSSIGTKLAQICHRHVTGWPVSSAVEGGGWPRPLSGGESALAR